MLEKGTIVTLQRLHDQRTEMELCMVLRKFFMDRKPCLRFFMSAGVTKTTRTRQRCLDSRRIRRKNWMYAKMSAMEHPEAFLDRHGIYSGALCDTITSGRYIVLHQ